MTPKWVEDILETEWLWVLSRIILTFMYWYAGLGFLLDFGGAVQTMTALGLEPAGPVAALTLIVELLGSVLVILDIATWFGAGMLAVFTLMTIPMVHHFWTMSGAAAMQARLESEEHLTVVGALIVVSILSAVRRRWRASRV